LQDAIKGTDFAKQASLPTAHAVEVSIDSEDDEFLDEAHSIHHGIEVSPNPKPKPEPTPYLNPDPNPNF